MTLEHMARLALDVQNACNLSGIVRTFAEVTAAMRAAPHNFDTPTCNRHPISVMFACKIADLTGAYGGVNLREAEEECKRIIQDEAHDRHFAAFRDGTQERW